MKYLLILLFATTVIATNENSRRIKRGLFSGWFKKPAPPPPDPWAGYVYGPAPPPYPPPYPPPFPPPMYLGDHAHTFFTKKIGIPVPVPQPFGVPVHVPIPVKVHVPVPVFVDHHHHHPPKPFLPLGPDPWAPEKPWC